MRFIHLSDLHIGKLLHGYNLRKDQEYILDQIVEHTQEINPDAIIIAGDIYDKSVPSAEAVVIFNDFITKLSQITPQVAILIIGGNHDSAERLEFAKSILDKNSIHIAGIPPRTPEEYIRKVGLTDEYGTVNFYLLPFVKPGIVRHVFDEPVEDYNSAVAGLINRENIDYSQRNVLVTHQFYTATGAETVRSASELISIGGIDNVDISAIEQFDYVAMGHIHGRQQIGRDYIRYCGTPMKYSISEQNQIKGFNIINIEEKGNISIDFVELKPLHNVRAIKGTLEEVINMAIPDNQDDYVSITLLDEEDLYRPKDQLADVYSNILEIRIDNLRVRNELNIDEDIEVISDPLQVFEQFFEQMQSREMTDKESEIIRNIINAAKEDN